MIRKFLKNTHAALLLILLSINLAPVYGQSSFKSIKLTIGTPDPIEVELVSKSATENRRLEYYYLPVNLRLSVNQQSLPEILFMAWDINNPQQVPQGILHWILTWGLTIDQEKEVQHLLLKIDSSAVLMGAVSVHAELREYKIVGLNDTMLYLLSKNISSGASIPTEAGGKSATSFKFSGPEALTMLSSCKKSDNWKKIFIEMPLYFTAPDGNVRFKSLKLEAKTIFKQLANCKECFKLI